MGRDRVGTPALREEGATELRAGTRAPHGLCPHPQGGGLTGKWNVELPAAFMVITFLMFPVRMTQDFKS